MPCWFCNLKKPEIRQSCPIPKAMKTGSSSNYSNSSHFLFVPYIFVHLSMSTGSHFSYTSWVKARRRKSRNKRTLTMFCTVSYSFCMREKESSFCLTSMLSKLWVAKDLFAKLQAISVLLVLITSLQQQQKNQSRLYMSYLKPTACAPLLH